MLLNCDRQFAMTDSKGGGRGEGGERGGGGIWVGGGFRNSGMEITSEGGGQSYSTIGLRAEGDYYGDTDGGENGDAESVLSQ